MEMTMDMATLFEMLTANYTRFSSLIARMSEKKMLEPSDEDTQSGKDIIAHVTSWQRRLTHWFQTVAQGKVPHSPEPGMTWEDMDRLNEQAALRDRHRTLEEVMTGFHASFQEFLSLVQSFSEEELNTTYPFAWGELNEGETGRPLWISALAGPGYAHYQDHFYDLLLRLEPSQRFTPNQHRLASYTGTYTLPARAPFMFSIKDGQLVAHRRGEVFSSLALDETRFAFKDLGLVTFNLEADGSVSSLEWWTWGFVRAEATLTDL